MIPFNKDEKPKELVPEGNHVAILYSIVEIGNVPDTYPGNEGQFVHQIRLTWELPDETREFDGEQKPMVIGRDFTVSLGDKSNLKPFVEGMLGGLSDEDKEFFSFENLKGKPCMLQVIHKKSKKTGNPYAFAASCAQVPKKLEVPKQFNESVYLDYREEWNDSVYATLPQFIKDKMADSQEMKSRSGFAENMDDAENVLGDIGR